PPDPKMSMVKKDELAPTTRSHEEIEHGAKTKQHPKQKQESQDNDGSPRSRKAPASAKIVRHIQPPKSQPRRPKTRQRLLSTQRRFLSLNQVRVGCI
ncbi:hypothetical protein BDN72DRAFT_843507, partial [Pluteus cervinus]